MGTRDRQSTEVGRLPDVGEIVQGRYRLEEIVATGGMGVIMRARQLAMDRDVAVKLLHPHMASEPETVARFEREVDLAKHLSHPHTIQLFDFGETDDGALYIVMEYLDGEDLKQVLRRGGGLEVRRAVEIGLQTLEGLAEAHDLDIVHRDLKPSNIFVVQQRRGGDFVKVLDFGVAKSLENDQSALTKTGRMCGTPMYMSPEVALQESPGKAADVYAMGLITLEMMIGHRVFHGNNMAQTLLMQLQNEVPIPTSLRGTELGEVIARATAKHPADRYRDADAMLGALERAASRLPDGLRVGSEDVPDIEEPAGSDMLDSAMLGDPDASLDDLRPETEAASSEAIPGPAEGTPPVEGETRLESPPPSGSALETNPNATPGEVEGRVSETEKLEAIEGPETGTTPPPGADPEDFGPDDPTVVVDDARTPSPSSSDSLPVDSSDRRERATTPDPNTPPEANPTERLEAAAPGSTVDDVPRSEEAETTSGSWLREMRVWLGAAGLAIVGAAALLAAGWIMGEPRDSQASTARGEGSSPSGTSTTPSSGPNDPPTPSGDAPGSEAARGSSDEGAGSASPGVASEETSATATETAEPNGTGGRAPSNETATTNDDGSTGSSFDDTPRERARDDSAPEPSPSAKTGEPSTSEGASPESGAREPTSKDESGDSARSTSGDSPSRSASEDRPDSESHRSSEEASNSPSGATESKPSKRETLSSDESSHSTGSDHGGSASDRKEPSRDEVDETLDKFELE